MAAVLLLALFRLRKIFGASLLYVTVGAFQYPQTVLTHSFLIPLGPGIASSPGTAALFSATLFISLMVYLREDTAETRTLMHCVVAANLVVSGMLALIGWHATANGWTYDLVLLGDSARRMLVGGAVFAGDLVALIAAYEYISQHVTRSLFLRFFLSLSTIQTVDTFTYTFFSAPAPGLPWTFIASTVFVKIGVTALHSSFAVLYLRFAETGPSSEIHGAPAISRFLKTLSYREKYLLYRKRAMRDDLTGLYNRGMFDTALPNKLDAAGRSGKPLVLLMIDIDHFKRFNDTYGHTTGDRVLRLFGGLLSRTFSSAAAAYRYGGEEFTVILEDTDLADAAAIVERLRSQLRKECRQAEESLHGAEFTATFGAAQFPQDGTEVTDLIQAADRRMYAGKRMGRDMVVTSDEWTSRRCPSEEQSKLV